MKKVLDRYSRLKLSLYAVAWTLAFTLPFIMQAYEVSSGYRSSFEWTRVRTGEVLVMSFFVLFLVNNFVLLPKLFMQRRKTLYFMAVVFALVVLWMALPVPHRPPRPRPSGLELRRPPINMFKVTNMIIGLCVICVNMAIKLYVDSMRREAMLMQVRSEQMRSELAGLRYQLNPHFLMNTLNNIQALALIGDSRTVEAIRQLSLLMRYILYETANAEVPLRKETDFLENFISLMKIRYTGNVIITFRHNDMDDVSVPPLLFVTFVENAFKHGVSYNETSPIDISLVQAEDRIIFTCENHVFGTHGHGHASGVGLENVRRRLHLIYGDSARLDIYDDGRRFKVNLQIPFTR